MKSYYNGFLIPLILTQQIMIYFIQNQDAQLNNEKHQLKNENKFI